MTDLFQDGFKPDLPIISAPGQTLALIGRLRQYTREVGDSCEELRIGSYWIGALGRESPHVMAAVFSLQQITPRLLGMRVCPVADDEFCLEIGPLSPLADAVDIVEHDLACRIVDGTLAEPDTTETP